MKRVCSPSATAWMRDQSLLAATVATSGTGIQPPNGGMLCEYLDGTLNLGGAMMLNHIETAAKLGAVPKNPCMEQKTGLDPATLCLESRHIRYTLSRHSRPSVLTQ